MIDALPRRRANRVFTHSSWAPDRTLSYERLEFLGDSVLELAVAHALYVQHPDFSEGRLAKVRSYVVSRATCAVVAHGNSSSRAIANAVRLAARGVEHRVVARLGERLPDRVASARP